VYVRGQIGYMSRIVMDVAVRIVMSNGEQSSRQFDTTPRFYRPGERPQTLDEVDEDTIAVQMPWYRGILSLCSSILPYHGSITTTASECFKRALSKRRQSLGSG
jgi:hypothetical protein